MLWPKDASGTVAAPGAPAAAAPGARAHRAAPPPSFLQSVLPSLRARDLERARRDRCAGATSVPSGPTTALGLTGLCLSGGGIRSATFSLGVLQVLARERMLERFDYLSTVSGGGYAGSCLSAFLAGDTPPLPDVGDRFPFRHTPGTVEPDAMKQLRAGRSYLAPGGLVDLVRIPALILRGVLVNLFCLLPYVMAAIVVTALLGADAVAALAKSTDAPEWGQLYRFTAAAAAAFLGLVAAWPVLAYVLTLGPMRERITERWTARNHIERAFAIGLCAVGVVFVLESLPLLIVLFHRLSGGTFAASAWGWLAAAVGTLPSMAAGKASEKVGRLGGKVALVALGILGPAVLLLVYVLLGDWLIVGRHAPVWAFALGGAALFLLTGLFVDANATSLHGFYRDRLSRAYLLAADADGHVDPAPTRDVLLLSRLSPRAPYHLLNATLNLQGDRTRDLRGREADFFLFSRCFVGSRQTGWCGTEALERRDRRINLGTAMAVSGAAAAPNMGTSTLKPLVFLMALLNVRLGYWVPNPGRVGDQGAHNFSPGPGPTYLLKELVSRLHARSWFVNVSDGGHLENLGLYALLERRCRFIVAVDGERDATLQLGALARVIRYARIDRGVEIDIDLTDLAPPKPSRHWALGTIDYGQGEKGWLLYVKASLTGDENPYIREYHDRNGDFPHESTGDQFFSEEQFEAYRALGAHVANDLFGKSHGPGADVDPDPGGGPMERWFQYLAKPPPLRGRGIPPVLIG
jgi:hypothetical protein